MIFTVFTSIRAKIIALMLLGIIGMSLITFTNIYFDRQKAGNIEIGRSSQSISRQILKIMMLEEHFIATGQEKSLAAIALAQQDVEKNLTGIKQLTKEPAIIGALAKISSLNQSHNEIFAQTSANLKLLTETRKQFKLTDDRIIALLQQVIHTIDERETALLMEGEYISTEETLLRTKAKDFIAFNGVKTVNLLNLFIFAEVDKYLAQKKTFTASLNKMIGDTRNIADLAGIAAHQQAWQQIFTLIDKNRGQEEEIFAGWRKKVAQLQELTDNSNQIQQAAEDIDELAQQLISAGNRKSRLTGITVALVGLLAMLIVGVMIIMIVLRPIRQTVNMLKDIAEGEGDLTRRLADKSRDEIGELARWFNQFIGKVQAIIAQVAEQVERLNHAAGNLARLSTGMTSGAEQVLTKANNVAAAAEQMSSNTANVAANTSQANENVTMTASAIQDMTTVINEIAGNTAKARSITCETVDQTGNANRQVNELGGAAEEIGKVIETITSISSQVNLLALNATIEAARAGEAGKGFAVVAGEIKELAQQTAAAAGEIKDRIESIQYSTKGTVAEIEAVTLKVNEVNEIVSAIAAAIEEQSSTTREIADTMTGVSRNLNEVNDNISQSSTVAGDIAAEITEVSQASRDLTDNSGEVNQSSRDLNSLAEQLDRIVRQFRIK
ncbi:MAG: methyl-accepting chemotaxis protein [Deltaproteobacteria bacterium]|nr:methyl-accepting chemotaxis protein [Deltaproteobacteria bacterium]